MPTRKQRKRMQKERRHEYETVWVDAEGNELEEPPDDAPAPARERRSADGKKSPPKRPQRTPNPRTPQPPSWRRAFRRGAILGIVAVAFIFIADSKSSVGNRVALALVWGVGYTGIFVAFTYYLDRFMYGRYQRKLAEQPKKR